ncbi:hypothetical protein GCE9029_04065 [Grimontia celer]|uniref:Uncharacterized protein n=1 Tax=Grimontia celer TaxID=1796497 RepID=A0A128FBI0_9GAMM|nr:hypothetical protein GCE9029_04065 [Grimontia celer]
MRLIDTESGSQQGNAHRIETRKPHHQSIEKCGEEVSQQGVLRVAKATLKNLKISS